MQFIVYNLNLNRKVSQDNSFFNFHLNGTLSQGNILFHLNLARKQFLNFFLDTGTLLTRNELQMYANDVEIMRKGTVPVCSVAAKDPDPVLL